MVMGWSDWWDVFRWYCWSRSWSNRGSAVLWNWCFTRRDCWRCGGCDWGVYRRRCINRARLYRDYRKPRPTTVVLGRVRHGLRHWDPCRSGCRYRWTSRLVTVYGRFLDIDYGLLFRSCSARSDYDGIALGKAWSRTGLLGDGWQARLVKLASRWWPPSRPLFERLGVSSSDSKCGHTVWWRSPLVRMDQVLAANDNMIVVNLLTLSFCNRSAGCLCVIPPRNAF